MKRLIGLLVVAVGLMSAQTPSIVGGAVGPTGPGYKASSTDSLATAGSGSKTFNLVAGLAYQVGSRIRATSVGTGEYMEGVVSSYAGAVMIVTMDRNSGTGTHADWNISIVGDVGPAATYSEYDAGTCTTTKALSAANGMVQKVLLGGNCTFSFVQPSTGVTWLQLKVTQDSTARTGTWTSVLWAGGTAPTISTGSAAVDMFTCYLNGTTTSCRIFGQDIK